MKPNQFNQHGSRSKKINPMTGRRYDYETEQLAKHAEENRRAEEQRAVEAELQLLERTQVAKEAADDLLTYARFTMPDPANSSDPRATSYRAQAFHKEVAKAMEAVERGDIQRLIFCMPPRHGKTELATKRFTAWLSGRHPDWNIAVGTYADSLAEDIGADVRNIMNTPQHKQVFPNHGLQKGGTSKSNMLTTGNGRLVFVGRGTGLTGKGAHCLTGDTEVVCREGTVKLRDVYVGQEVLSYCQRSCRIVWRPVEAIARRPAARIYRVADNQGRVVEATGDHRFFAGGRWVVASELSPGDRLLCAVRDGGDQASCGRDEARAPGVERHILLEQVLGGSAERTAVRRTDVPAMRGASAEGDELRVVDTAVLLAGVPGAAQRRGIRGAEPRQTAPVFEVQRDVRADDRDTAVLQPGLRGSRALGPYARRGEPTMEGRSVQAEDKAARRSEVSGDTSAGPETGREPMPVMRGHGEAERASHRREPAEQQDGEFGDLVLGLPHESPLFGSEGSVVVSVEDTGRSAVVYDIQVAETECFFANGVLVHNCLLIDDILKDHEEARSQTIRDQAWNWFTKVALTRLMGRKLVVVTMTRWHSDDLVGRLTDPENPHYNAIEAAKWKIIRLPAIAEDDDPLGREPGEPLWPEAFDADFLASQQRIDPLGFAALYQQTPTVADGTLFRRETIQRYEPNLLPEGLRYYATSDHALGTKQRNDPSCFLKGGVDNQGNLWLTEMFWQRVPSDRAVDMMLEMGAGADNTTRPLIWWAERGHISKSIGPFLQKRMLETGRYLNVQEVTPIGDKEQRAQSVAARVALGKVYFPKGALWDKAIEELMAFPNGLHDDFVDALSLFGLGLTSQFGKAERVEKKEPRFGTWAWVKAEDAARSKAVSMRNGGF